MNRTRSSMWRCGVKKLEWVVGGAECWVIISAAPASRPVKRGWSVCLPAAPYCPALITCERTSEPNSSTSLYNRPANVNVLGKLVGRTS